MKKDCKVKSQQKFSEGKEHPKYSQGKSNMAWSFMSDQGISGYDTWILDSGASRHLSGEFSLLHNVEKDESLTVHCADGMLLRSQSRGDALVNLKGFCIVIRNVFYVPGLKVNLLSVSQMVSTGNEVIFQGDVALIKGENCGKIRVRRVENMYLLKVGCSAMAAAVNEQTNIKDIHERFGHTAGNGCLVELV
jgi:hypothetical protein